MSNKHPVNHNLQDPVIDNVIAWLKAGGCDVSSLTIKPAAGKGRCAFATKRLRSSETILYIPHEYMMTSVVAESSDIGVAIAKSNVHLQSDHTVLAAFMLQEKRNNFSFWKPYLDTIPENFNQVPLFFDADTLSELKGSSIVEHVLNRRYSLATEYRALAGSVPAFKCFSWQEFLWARTAITTRCFSTMIDGQKAIAMVPILDLLNHSNAAAAQWKTHLAGIVMTANNRVGKDEEVHNSYGEKSTNRFFSSYGFINEDESGDECSITPHLSYRDELYHAKLQLLDGERCQEFSLRAAYNDPFKQCLSYVRFVVKDCLLDEYTQPEFFALDNEMQALTLLRDGCWHSLECYGTSLTEDETLLAQTIDDTNKRHCIEIRSREKKVLHAIITFVDEALAIWPHEERAPKLADASSNAIVRDYFNDVLYESKSKVWY